MKKLSFISVLVLAIGTCFTVSAFAEFYVVSVQNKCGPCKGTRSSGGRWCDNGNGTATDMTTCLVWLKYANWGKTRQWRSGETDCSGPDYPCYDDAHQRAGLLEDGETLSSGETLTDGSVVGDWRLPTKTELVEITIGDEYVRSGTGGQLFEEVQSSHYWSSTTGESAYLVYIVYMSDGTVSFNGKVGWSYVWPVRSDN